MKLERLFPHWHGIEGTLHLLLRTRRGLPPAVCALVDHLAASLRDEEPARSS